MRRYKPVFLYQTLQRSLNTRRGRAYGTLALSVFTAAFFATFATKPTLITIISLRRQVTDYSQVDTQLKEKIDTLSRLSYTYRTIESDLPLIEAALPSKTDLPSLLNSLAAAGERSGTTMTGLAINDILLSSASTDKTAKISSPQLKTVNFTVSYAGSYPNLLKTLETFNKIPRLIIIDSFSFTVETEKGRRITLKISGKAFNLATK